MFKLTAAIETNVQLKLDSVWTTVSKKGNTFAQTQRVNLQGNLFILSFSQYPTGRFKTAANDPKKKTAGRFLPTSMCFLLPTPVLNPESQKKSELPGTITVLIMHWEGCPCHRVSRCSVHKCSQMLLIPPNMTAMISLKRCFWWAVLITAFKSSCAPWGGTENVWKSQKVTAVSHKWNKICN